MLRKALTTAVLVAATLAGASEARAAPGLQLSVTILDERITLANGKRGWSHQGSWSHGGKWQHQGFKRRGGYHRGNDFGHRGRGYYRGNGFAAKRVGRGVVVIRPSYKSFRYQYRPVPLIRNGSFARSPYRW